MIFNLLNLVKKKKTLKIIQSSYILKKEELPLAWKLGYSEKFIF